MKGSWLVLKKEMYYWTKDRRTLFLTLFFPLILYPLLFGIMTKMGMKDSQIIMKHIVPNVLPAIYAVAFLAIGVVIVVEGSLSLLGVGIVDGVSWGSMIARVRGDLEYAPHSMIVPVVVLALTVIACNQLGDVLRSQLDSREGRL